MADGFLGRWSQRKADARSGRPLQEPVPASPAAPKPRAPGVQGQPGAASASAAPIAVAPSVPPASPATPALAECQAAESPPTLEDVRALTPSSDFRRFVTPGVQPEVRNAALKKLFSDPHFNVMDGLDIYIDDYSQPDPLPLSLLRKMSSAQFLGLVEEEGPKDPQGPGTRPASGQPPAEAQAQAADAADNCHPAPAPQDAEPERPESDPDADPNLRLQQDHAPGPEVPGRVAQ